VPEVRGGRRSLRGKDRGLLHGQGPRRRKAPPPLHAAQQGLLRHDRWSGRLRRRSPPDRSLPRGRAPVAGLSVRPNPDVFLDACAGAGWTSWAPGWWRSTRTCWWSAGWRAGVCGGPVGRRTPPGPAGQAVLRSVADEVGVVAGRITAPGVDAAPRQKARASRPRVLATRAVAPRLSAGPPGGVGDRVL